jgi:FkbM family methyltransferase
MKTLRNRPGTKAQNQLAVLRASSRRFLHAVGGGERRAMVLHGAKSHTFAMVAAIAAAARTGDDLFFHSLGTMRAKKLQRWCPPPGVMIPWNHTLVRHLAQRPHPDPSGRRTLVLDIGAFDGSDAVVLGDPRKGARQRVWSFEPSPTKVSYIQGRLNQSDLGALVTLHPIALSNSSGVAQFQMFSGRRIPRPMRSEMKGAFGSPQDMLYSNDVSSSKKQSLRVGAGHAKDVAHLVDVPVRTLDSMLTGDGAGVESETSIPFMKVDAQGFDFRVLHGASQLLRSGRVEVLVFELCLALVPGGRPEAAAGFEMLRDMGADCVPCGDWTTPKQFHIRMPTTIRKYLAPYDDRFDNIVCQMRPSL